MPTISPAPQEAGLRWDLPHRWMVRIIERRMARRAFRQMYGWPELLHHINAQRRRDHEVEAIQLHWTDWPDGAA